MTPLPRDYLVFMTCSMQHPYTCSEAGRDPDGPTSTPHTRATIPPPLPLENAVVGKDYGWTGESTLYPGESDLNSVNP
jgi:hypothetical protein